MAGLTQMLTNALAEGTMLVYVLVFVGGVAASFTPCTYPVIPLTVGYIGNRAGGKQRAAFFMSLALVVGMALVYAALGMIFAAIGMQFGQVWSSGWALFTVAMFFMIMGLFLMDALRFPSLEKLAFLRAKVASENKGILGALLVGGVSALVVGPCTGPILAVVIGVVTVTLRDAEGMRFVLGVIDGGAKLFLFGLGQGALILIAGTFTGFLAKLPRSGAWLEKVKKGFAMLVIVGASLLLVYVGQATDFPDLSAVLSGTGGRTESTVGAGVDAPGVPAGDASVSESGDIFGGDEFLD